MHADTYIPRRLDNQWKIGFWDVDVAAPLLCAGITTYSPLRHWNVGGGQKVGVVGLGGLGHMAVKLAKAMGAEVTVLSQSRVWTAFMGRLRGAPAH